jgi:hypothetical protein
MEAPPSSELPVGRGKVIVRLYENEIPISRIQCPKITDVDPFAGKLALAVGGFEVLFAEPPKAE